VTGVQTCALPISCEDQAELDRYFDALTADGGKDGPCGWVTDKYGLSWQLVTKGIMANYRTGDREGIARMMAAMMTMRKLDTAAMQAAFEGKSQ
jgi:predicted 3-demethylubiquinone-9 3-methyltransferase (glyoxalase superfamily)